MSQSLTAMTETMQRLPLTEALRLQYGNAYLNNPYFHAQVELSMRTLEPKLRRAIEKFVAEHEPVIHRYLSAKTVMWFDGQAIEFDRCVFPLKEGYDSDAFSYDFYHNAYEGDRYVYENRVRKEMSEALQMGWIPVRLDVWTSQGRKSRPAKPARLDVWFVTKTDTANQNATRYNSTARSRDGYNDTKQSGRQRYEGPTW